MFFDLCALYTYTGPCCACVHLFSFVYCFTVRQLVVGNKIITQYMLVFLYMVSQLHNRENYKLTNNKMNMHLSRKQRIN